MSANSHVDFVSVTIRLYSCRLRQLIINCERFEPRSHFKSRLSLIVWGNVVLNYQLVTWIAFNNIDKLAKLEKMFQPELGLLRAFLQYFDFV